MDLERLVALIVKTVVEELIRQDAIRIDRSEMPAVREISSPEAALTPANRRAGGRVVSAQMILDAASAGAVSFEAPPRAIITPLAMDTAREKGIRIIKAEEG